MGKIIDFTPTHEQFFKMAVGCDGQKDYYGALDYVNRAIEALNATSEKGVEYVKYMLFKAEVLALLGAYEASNDVLFRTSAVIAHYDIYIALAHNYFMLNEYAVADYYVQVCLDSESEKVYDSAEMLSELIDTSLEVENNNVAHLLKLAEGIIKSNNPDYAMEILRFVPSESKFYLDALHYNATILLQKGEFDRAKTYVDQAIALSDGNDLTVLCTALTISAGQGNAEDVAHYLGLINNFKIGAISVDLAACVVLALAFAESHQSIVDFADKVIKTDLFCERLYIFNAIALYKLGNSSDALNRLKTVILVNPSNENAKYLYKSISNGTLSKEHSYSMELPADEYQRRVMLIEEFCERGSFDAETWAGGELLGAISWAFNTSKSDLVGLVLNAFGHLEEVNSYLADYLLKDSISDLCKKIILFTLIDNGVSQVNAVIGGRFKSFSYQFPTLTEEYAHFYTSYSYTLCVMSFLDEGFEERCCNVFKRMFKSYIKNGSPELRVCLAISAVFAYYMGVFDGDTKKLCEVFSCNKATFYKYKKIFGDDK